MGGKCGHREGAGCLGAGSAAPKNGLFVGSNLGGSGAQLGASGSQVEWFGEFRKGGQSRRVRNTPYSGDQVEEGRARKTLTPHTVDPRAPRRSRDLWAQRVLGRST